MLTRRAFLAGTAVAAVALSTGCSTGSAARSKRPWNPVTPLRIPPELRPRTAAGVAAYNLRLQVGRTEFLAGKPTETWGVNGSFLGPTLRLRSGDEVALRVYNGLPEQTTLHWHGLRPPARFDGGPHQRIDPGTVWEARWRLDQQASTAWYHPHPHGGTAEHVFKGVAGMIIVDDPRARGGGPRLPSSYGVDDIPVILTDRTIDDTGAVQWETEPNFGQFGTDILVNGTLQPVATCRRQRTRLRVLNASSARRYHLELSDGRPFLVVATDSGLLPAPVESRRVSLGPAERAEVIVTLERGRHVELITRGGDERVDAGDLPVLRMVGVGDLAASPKVPDDLGGLPPIVAPAGATARTFHLQGHEAISGLVMDMGRIDHVIPAGTTEVWTVTNNVYAHNFHVHGAEFTVLDIDGRPPEAWESGRKDTVHVSKNRPVRLAVTFAPHTDPVSPYMYHCHILRHEDAGMMGQFVLVKPGTEAEVATRLPTSGLHGSHARIERF